MRRVILDTDLGMGSPGSDIDDGFALALALADPGLQVDLVTTVNGNTDVDTATRLTVELLARLGRSDLPVARGAATPLVGSWTRAQPGMPTFRPPGEQPPVPSLQHAAAQMVDRVMAAPGEMTIVAIGPLTNVALALALEPQVASAVREIVIMGGVFFEHTNVAAVPGEFNFSVDPHAADEVLTSGATLRVVGLDVTRQVRLTRDQARQMQDTDEGSSFVRFAAERALEWISHLERTTPGDLGRGSCALHDPLAVAAITRPDLVTWRPAYVRVETAGERTRGVAVADLMAASDPPEPNCDVAARVDAEEFLTIFLQRLAQLP